ncbi:MAG TPA: DNA repair protein RecO [Burkholderiaceae bacterium]|nr:DNA repair protein RecO [Burkholderiaceae bacterium]
MLHSYDWSESSLIVELFTRDAGRVVAAAKGAKRPTSQLRAVLMPFQPVAVQFARSRGDLGEVRTLRTAEWGGGEATMLQGSDWFSGFYINELLLRMLARDDPQPRLFDAYAATLRSLGHGEARSEAALRAFELLLLRESGVLPDLGRTTPTQKALSPAGRYVLRSDQGLVEAAAGEAAIAAETCLALASALERSAGQPPVDDALQALQGACARELPALKTLLRSQLHYHLGGAPLRTRQLVLDTQRLLEANSPPR